MQRCQIWYECITILILLQFVAVAEADILDKIQSLGGNDVLYEKARILTPEKNITIVHKRLINRSFKNELNFEANNIVGGDVFLQTILFGLNYQFHISPYWSVGIKGYIAFNDLSSEGNDFVNHAINLRYNFNQLKPLVPDIDYMRYSSYLISNWYPIYGKLNLYDIGIGHYDIYILSGIGRVWLRRGGAIGFIAGGGFAFWISDNISTRIEVKYETYKAQRLSINSEQRLHLTSISLSVGYIL